MDIVQVLSSAKDAIRELFSRWDLHGAGDPSLMYFSVDDAVCRSARYESRLIGTD